MPAQPGEFFVRPSGLDDGGGTLLYIPVEGETPSSVGAVLPRMQELVVLDGADDVAFSSVELSHSDWACGGLHKNETCDKQSAEQQQRAAFRVRNAHNVGFDKVNITHVGYQALWFEQGVSGASFARGHILDLGTGAIRVGPWVGFPGEGRSGRYLPGNKPEAVRNVVVTDSLLSDGGWVFAAGTAFFVQTNTTNISLIHCEISYFSYTAM